MAPSFTARTSLSRDTPFSCCTLAKPSPLSSGRWWLIAGTDPTPSDFVRTEWLRFDPNDKDKSAAALRTSFEKIEELAEFYFKQGEVGLDADVIDYELTLERFKQAVLIANHLGARRRISEIVDRLRRSTADASMTAHRQRLRETSSQFLKFLPR